VPETHDPAGGVGLGVDAVVAALLDPAGAPRDGVTVLGDQEASRRGYARMCADGYGDLAIPVFQVMPAWVNGLSAEANAHLAARDPVLRGYVDRAPLVAIGGLNHGSCPRGERHLYLGALCRAFPSAQLWALGQANPVEVNGLGCAGLLDRVWVDGTWWIVRHVSPKSRAAGRPVRRGTAS
jgi:hypothetical protein